jgi:hypothetical protein
MIGGEVVEQHVRPGEEHREQVVEVVRDPARDLSQRLDPLRLAQRLLEGAALGEIEQRRDDAHRLTTAVAQDAQVRGHRPPRPVGPAQA